MRYLIIVLCLLMFNAVASAQWLYASAPAGKTCGCFTPASCTCPVQSCTCHNCLAAGRIAVPGEQAATIQVRCSTTATITFDGKATTSTGSFRTFTAPRGGSYIVQCCDGNRCTTETVRAVAGQTVIVDFGGWQRSTPVPTYAVPLPAPAFGGGYGNFNGCGLVGGGCSS